MRGREGKMRNGGVCGVAKRNEVITTFILIFNSKEKLLTIFMGVSGRIVP
jgi:hypothetical protein